MPRSLLGFARPALACLFAGLGALHVRYHAGYTLDDAYITYRYARHGVRGLGLVYNAGDYVKGYSNTLYTFLMMLPEAAGIDPNATSKAIGLASFLGVCALAYRAYEGDAALRDRAPWVVALVAASSALAVHAIGGLETGLHTLLVFAAVLARVREQAHGGIPWSAGLFCAVVWSRPEGILIFAAAAVHDAVFRSITRRVQLRDLVFYLAPVIAYAAELGASLAYYGAAFPQTYYAKTRAVHGVLEHAKVLWDGARAQLAPESYLSLGLRGAGVGWLGLAVTPLAFIDPRVRRRNSAALLAVFAQLVFVVRAGGDWAPAFRFGAPVLPLLFLLLVDVIGQLARWARRYERLVLPVLAAAGLGVVLPEQLRESQKIAAERPVNAENKLAQGAFFATLAPPGITLASFDIGGHGYAAGGFDILDAVGLTVRETTGCRDRMLPRCVRYAQLIAPELVRLHNNRKRDGFVSRTVSRDRPYLALDGGRYLLDRALVLGGELPDGLSSVALAAIGGGRLAGADLPPALRPGQPSSLVLYWRRTAPDAGAIVERRLEWRGPAGHFSAQTSESLFRHTDLPHWKDGELFADLARVVAPPRPGRYQLQLVAGGQRVVLGELECVDAEAAAEVAQRWIERATGPSALRWLARAAELDAAARPAYHRAAVASAVALRREAERELGRDRLAALRIAQRGKRILLEAYWRSGRASAQLRREIDANAALRGRIISMELDPLR